MVLGSFANDAEARRRRRSKRAPIINEKKLYERMGGAQGVSDVVDEWVRQILADSRLSQSFETMTAKPEALKQFRRSLNDQICEIADGPCKYKGRDMKQAHLKLTITEEQFLAFSENLFRAMQKYNVPEREKNELLGRIGGLRGEIVSGEQRI